MQTQAEKHREKQSEQHRFANRDSRTHLAARGGPDTQAEKLRMQTQAEKHREKQSEQHRFAHTDSRTHLAARGEPLQCGQRRKDARRDKRGTP